MYYFECQNYKNWQYSHFWYFLTGLAKTTDMFMDRGVRVQQDDFKNELKDKFVKHVIFLGMSFSISLLVYEFDKFSSYIFVD